MIASFRMSSSISSVVEAFWNYQKKPKTTDSVSLPSESVAYRELTLSSEFIFLKKKSFEKLLKSYFLKSSFEKFSKICDTC